MPKIADLGLAGRLILIQWRQNGNKLFELDLKTGETRVLFQSPKNSWLSEAVVSPDNQQILLTYAPPPPSDKSQPDKSGLYLLPFGSSDEPQPLILRSHAEETFSNTAWASDGQSIYYTHLYRVNLDSDIPSYQNDIEKATLSGERETIIEHAVWPAISPDGGRMAYLQTDPATSANVLYIANSDGSNQAPVLQPGSDIEVDAHLFSKDGEQLIFSMVNAPIVPASSWLDRLLGIQPAFAHSEPSDWYRVSLSGRVPQRLTKLKDMNLYGDLSPDGSQIAFISSTGLYVMNIDGSNLVQLSKDVMIGTVNWLP